MLEDFLKDIYEKAKTIELLKETAFYSNLRNPYKCYELWNEAMASLKPILNDLQKTDAEKYNALLSNTIKAQESFNDRLYFPSLIENDVIPLIMEYIKPYCEIQVDDGNWTLLSSSTGFLTLREKDGMFAHNSSDPMWESFLYANNIYKPHIRRYNILGGGLGYPAYQLCRLSAEDEAEIYVYEIDDKVREYSDLFGVKNLIDSDKVHWIYEDDKDKIIEQFFNDIESDDILRTVYYWNESAYFGVYADNVKIFQHGELTNRVFGARIEKNYLSNLELDHQYMDSFNTDLFRDEWVIVAAGPSLNDNKDFIEESVGKRTICAINASLKWFSINGIVPTLCVACDPNFSLVPHIEGIEEFSKKVPLIMDCITNRSYAKKYKGQRYYIVSDSSISIADKKIIEKDGWAFGGTVTSMAIEAAFRYGARKVFIIGADLSYPGKVTYADGVGHEVATSDGDGQMVVSVEDRMIPSTKVFSEYIFQIETQILEHPNVEVINRSNHGAYLRGAFCGSWWEDIPDSERISDYLRYLENIKRDSFILGWKEKYYILCQTLSRIESHKLILSDQSESEIDSIYQIIYNSFKDELNMHDLCVAPKTSGLVYIFTSEFWDETDEHSLEVLKLAQKEARNNKNVLIINTMEKIAGTCVPIHNAVLPRFNEKLMEAEKVNYDNRTFLYFQFSGNMPDLNQYSVFLDSLKNKIPEKMYSTSRFSLLGDFCSELFNK